MSPQRSCLVFLDFDGVLRRKDATPRCFEKPLLDLFESAVRRIPGAEIVITSSWRDIAGLKELRRLFSPDVAQGIVGVTPFVPGGRYREILAYRSRAAAEGRPWVAVDDDPVSYPSGIPLILVDPATGFTEKDADRLVEMAANSPLYAPEPT